MTIVRALAVFGVVALASAQAPRSEVNWPPGYIDPGMPRPPYMPPETPLGSGPYKAEEAIRQWKRVSWPRIKKARTEGRTIVFIDESG